MRDDFADLLGARRLACAESCTGGLLSQAFATTRGSMDWFAGGIVAYQRRTKEALLDIPPAPLVSAEVAEGMALGAARLLAADVAVSITCAAGPDPLEGAEVGTVVVGLSVDGSTSSTSYFFHGTPAQICAHARDAAIDDLERALTVRSVDV